MKNAAKPSFEYDDEEGAAENAAVLGADGGPVGGTPGTDLAIVDDFDDADWLDEELTDEELAALGEEDFEEAFAEDFDEGDFDDDEFVEGDLEGFDDLDEFELLEAPKEAPEVAVEASHEVEEPVEDAFVGGSLDEDIGDDLFEVAGGETAETVTPGTPEDTAELPPVEDDVFEENIVEEEAFYDNSETLDFDIDDEFSLDEDLASEEEPQGETTGAAIVTVGASEVKTRDTGDVVASDDEAVNATHSEEPTFKDDDLPEDEDDFTDMEEDDGTYHRPVPRISIHAFCETSRNSAIIEKAAVDRRLQKAHFTMHMGGLEKAIDLYQSSSTPNLIILETVHGGVELIQQLGQLAEVCDPSTKVVIIGRVNDIRLYRELIRQGISEYVVRPKSPLQIIKTISELYVDPSAPPIGKTVAFVGTRGGTGSSTMAHNFGWLFAEEHKSDTVILDLDLPFGTTALDFDHEPTSGLMEALTSPERLDDVLLERLLQKHTDHLSLFTAPNMLDRDYDIDAEAFDTVIDVIRGTAPTVVIDVPHNWTGWSRKILQTADEIVITATPDFASFRNMKYLLEVINSARPNDSRPYFIYNQYDPKMSAVPVDYFVENTEIEPSLILGWEPQLFNAAATNACSIMETNSKSKVAQGLNDLAGKILGRTETLALPSRFSLTSLFKRK